MPIHAPQYRPFPGTPLRRGFSFGEPLKKLTPPPRTKDTSLDAWMFDLYERMKSLDVEEDSGFPLSVSQAAQLKGGGDTTLHYHAEDRKRSNHTGTQPSSSISDFESAVRALVQTAQDHALLLNNAWTASGHTGTASRFAAFDASGVAAHWSVGTSLELSGTTLQRSALTGDVTASAGSNATTIANDAVTFAKMQNIATDRLMGRDTALSGDPEEISVGGGLEFTGTGGIQRSALTGDVTANAGSNACTIPNDTVTYAKMQNVSATDRLLGRATAGAGDVEEIVCNAFGRSIINATVSAGNVLFASSSSAIGTSGNFFWDSSNNRLGIGTGTPQNALVVSNAGAAGFEVDPAGYAGGVRMLIYNRSSAAYAPARWEASQHEFHADGAERALLTATALTLGSGMALAVPANVTAGNYYPYGEGASSAFTFGFATTAGPAVQLWGTSTGPAGAMLFLTAGTERARITDSGLAIGGTSFGASATKVLSIANGTAPTTGPADTVQFYSSDDAAGHTIPSFYCEGTNVIATGQADSASSVRVKMRINGTVVTLLAV